jgi:hypothetical protein
MSRSFNSWSCVMIVAALLAGGVVGRALVAPQQMAGQRLGVDEPAANSRAAADSPVGLESNLNRAAAGHDTDGAPDEFRDWLARYAAKHPDRDRLRRDLEAALAELSGDDGPSSPSDELAAFQEIERAEQTVGDDYATLLDQVARFLELYPSSPLAADARKMFDKYALAWDKHDFDAAREFSRENPDRFESRIARYQAYLERHAAAGSFATDARLAIETIRMEWDEHDYRAICEFNERYPYDIAALTRRLRQYGDDHPASQRRAAVDAYLSSYERAAQPSEYRVRVKSGKFTHDIARGLTRGPDLAVELEVAGVRLGRSPIVSDSFEPVWNYEFPKNVRWRIGDPVTVRVTDFDYGNRTILKIESAGDPLALRNLTGTLRVQGHELTFECDFQPPALPPLGKRLAQGRYAP